MYESSQKLAIDLHQIEVTRGDFDKALRKIVPSTHRVEDKILSPLPKHVKPLLESTHLTLVANLKRMFPHCGVGKGAILPKILTHRKIIHYYAKFRRKKAKHYITVFEFFLSISIFFSYNLMNIAIQTSSDDCWFWRPRTEHIHRPRSLAFPWEVSLSKVGYSSFVFKFSKVSHIFAIRV